MLLEHERYYVLGMNALVSACSWNTNRSMVWARMLCLSHAHGTRTEVWFGHGCSGYRAQSRIEKRNAWYTQYFGPLEHLECVDRPTQATSGEVGQVCFFCALRSGGANNNNNKNNKKKYQRPNASTASRSN